MKTALFILLLAVLQIAIPAAEEVAAQHTQPPKNQLLFLPFLFYTPETSLAFGGAGSYIFRTSKKNPDLRPSSISPMLVYTTKKQFRFELLTHFYFQNDDFYLHSLLKWKYYPDLFFGIGNDTQADRQSAYTTSGVDWSGTLFRKIGKHFYTGIRYQFAAWKISGPPLRSDKGSTDLRGDTDGRISGFTLLASQDNRDNIYTPHQGSYLETGFCLYPRFLGSSFPFYGFQFNLRRYIPFFNGHTLAIQALFEGKGGDVPFIFMSELGGQNFLRGYYQGRFRDKSLFLLQGEYRLPLFWRFGAAGFLSAGQVMNRLDQFGLRRFHWAGGMGIRYLFSKNEGITLRLDVAFSEEKPSFYLSIFEAF